MVFATVSSLFSGLMTGDLAVPISLEGFLSLTSLTVMVFISPTTLGSISSLVLRGEAFPLPYIMVMPLALGPHLGDIDSLECTVE